MTSLVKRYQAADGTLVAIDDVRDEAARCCDETARMERGERDEIGSPLNGKPAEFTDAAFGVACEVALVVGESVRSAGMRVAPHRVWSTAADMLRKGWQRGNALVGVDLTKPGKVKA